MSLLRLTPSRWTAGLLVLAALACDAPKVSAPPQSVGAVPDESSRLPRPMATAEQPRVVSFQTYEGSGEVVHPDVVSFPAAWHGFRLWSTLTPYPRSATQFENPSLFGSDHGDTWEVPAGVTNPLARTTRGHLSDPDMLFEPASGELWMYYREVENAPGKHGKSTHIADHVWLIHSADGANWSTPRRIISDSGRYVVSPSVVRAAEGDWRMYQVDAGTAGCSARSSQVTVRRSTDGVVWSESTPAGLTQPGYVAWHLDVQYVASRREFWALTAAYPSRQGCMATSLFLATSRDGTTWTTYPSPVLAPGDLPQFSSAVYRSTFAITAPDSVTVWFSGARVAQAKRGRRPAVFAWGAAASHLAVDSLFRRVRNVRRPINGASGLDGRASFSASVP